MLTGGMQRLSDWRCASAPTCTHAEALLPEKYTENRAPGSALQDAEEAYSQALSHQTSSAVLWANRSAARLSSGKAEEALADARLARTVDPQYMKVVAPYLVRLRCYVALLADVSHLLDGVLSSQCLCALK